MKIAVACTADFTQIAGHAGRARRWLVFEDREQPRRIELASSEVFHYFDGGVPHPLDGVEAIIAQSAGESFLAKMEGKGVNAVLTAETDPAKAVSDYLGHQLAAPRPRPIGALICKAIDLFSRHK